MSPVRSVKLADTIAQHIRQLILEGTLKPGERLIAERDLSAKLSVSRPSLREGLNKLVAEGLLTTNVQGMTYVNNDIGRSLRDPLLALIEDPEARYDFIELRTVIESAAAGFAAERASEVDRRTLQARFQAMVEAHDRDDIDAIGHSDAEFHFALYEASHNIMMLQIMRSLEVVLRSNIYLNRHNLYKHWADRGGQLEEHRAILDAVLAGDASGARATAAHHMQSALNAQQAIQKAEERLATSVRRLSRSDLATDKRKRRGST
jgi:GntR family transcriptional repressor for pyruvate dehydrogenase complex